MSRPDLLRMVAHHGHGQWPMPSAIDGLQEPNVPSLYFHDVPEDLLKPWMIALDATLIETKRMDGFADIPTFDVLLFVGRHLGARVDVRVYRTVK